ncbi:MAG: hypothetical protein QNJ54_07735 [Prochloraceae cyanobacterium]|nr:hypothetical protein [Prochloraceae cyanobacterium]
MAIVALRAWYLEQYEPIKEVIKRPHDLRLSRNSLLKSGLRADFLNERKEAEKSVWLRRYLEGETVEFYIEGSGSYIISNIDIISQEIYFTKQQASAWLEPVIFLSHQREYTDSSDALRQYLIKTIDILNQRSRFEICLEESQRPAEVPMRLSSTQMNKIRKSLLFVADVTSVATCAEKENKIQLIPSPSVCVEIGYALQSKGSEEILLVKMAKPDLVGEYPFELPPHQQLEFKKPSELETTLPRAVENLLTRFNLFRQEN